MTKLSPGGQYMSLNVVRFDRLFQGRVVVTPLRVSSRKELFRSLSYTLVHFSWTVALEFDVVGD